MSIRSNDQINNVAIHLLNILVKVLVTTFDGRLPL